MFTLCPGSDVVRDLRTNGWFLELLVICGVKHASDGIELPSLDLAKIHQGQRSRSMSLETVQCHEIVYCEARGQWKWIAGQGQGNVQRT